MRSALASGLSRRQAIWWRIARAARAGRPRGRAGLRAGAHAAVALRLFGLAAEPAALGQHRRLGRHGEDADPRPPHRLRPGRQAGRRAGRKLLARRGRRLGVPAHSERDLPQRRSGHVGRRPVHDRADRRRKIDRLHARPVPGHRAHRDARSAHHPSPHQAAGRDAAVLVRQLQHADPVGEVDRDRVHRLRRLPARRPGARHVDRARRQRQVFQARPAAHPAHPLRRLCGREPARRRAAVRRRGHDRIRAVAVDGRGRARPAAQDGYAVRAVHGRAVQRHQGAVLRRARAARRRPCGAARGHRAGRLLRPRQGAGRRADRRRHAVLGSRSCRAAGATTSPRRNACSRPPACRTASRP